MKLDLDHVNPANFRPISRLNQYGNSTVLNDVYCSVDDRSRSLLLLLDLFTVFNCINFGTLLRWLEHTFSIMDNALLWLPSYVTNRSQSVQLGGETSIATQCKLGVQQALFTLYVHTVWQISCLTLLVLSATIDTDIVNVNVQLQLHKCLAVQIIQPDMINETTKFSADDGKPPETGKRWSRREVNSKLFSTSDTTRVSSAVDIRDRRTLRICRSAAKLPATVRCTWDYIDRSESMYTPRLRPVDDGEWSQIQPWSK